MIVRPLVGFKRVVRGKELKDIDVVTPNDEIIDGRVRLGLCLREPGAALCLIAEVSEAEQAEALELLKQRDNEMTGKDDDYADRHIIKAPIIRDVENDNS